MAHTRQSLIERTAVGVVVLAGAVFVPSAMAQCDDQVKFGEAILHRQPYGRNPVAIRAGDFDLDGDVDIAPVFFSHPDDIAAVIVCQVGDWTFADCDVLDYSWHVNDGEFVDIDGDGDLDAAIVAYNSLRVLPNDGTGHFGHAWAVSYDTWFSSVRAADIDGDGDQDLVMACEFHDAIGVLLNDGAGTLAWPSYFAAGDGSHSLALGDLDHDGDLDVATADLAGASASVLLNRGDGSFDPPTLFPVGSTPFSITAGDFDRDGDLDLVTANSDSGDASVLLNNGDATFAPSITLASGDKPVSVAAGDIDGDGDSDFVVANRSGIPTHVFVSDGAAGFETIDLAPLPSYPQCVTLADLDGDTDLDVAVGTVGSAFYLFPNTGTYSARITRQPSDTFACPGDSISLSVGATGTDLAFQWLKDGVEIPGATNAALTILSAGQADEAAYSVLVSNGCSGVLSEPAHLTVGDDPCCAADFNRDGVVDASDAAGFVDAFEGANTGADFNADGFVNGDDFDLFAEHFDVGC